MSRDLGKPRVQQLGGRRRFARLALGQAGAPLGDCFSVINKAGTQGAIPEGPGVMGEGVLLVASGQGPSDEKEMCWGCPFSRRFGSRAPHV